MAAGLVAAIGGSLAGRSCGPPVCWSRVRLLGASIKRVGIKNRLERIA